MARLDVTFVLSDGADSGSMRIDGTGVRIKGGVGSKVIDDRLEKHWFSLVFGGTKGGKLKYEIRLGDRSLAKDVIEIGADFPEGAAAGWLPVKSR